MGTVIVDIGVSSLSDLDRKAQVTALADTGATVTVVPRAILRDLGIEPAETVRFRVADGRIVERQVGFGFVFVDGRRTPARLAFGEPSDPSLLGLVVLAELGFAEDPVGRRLVPGDLILYGALHRHGPR